MLLVAEMQKYLNVFNLKSYDNYNKYLLGPQSSCGHWRIRQQQEQAKAC